MPSPTGGRALPFAPARAEEIVAAVERTEPADHGLSGHLWTTKKLRAWILHALGVSASRGTVRNALKKAGLSWKKIEKMLGKADPDKRAAHVERLEALYEQVRRGEVVLIYADEAHLPRDADPGYARGRVGGRVWRNSGCARPSERLNCYGAYDFTNGACLLWEDGRCDGGRTGRFHEEVKRWRAGKTGRLVVVWDNAPCHRAKAVTAKAAELGTELVFLPGYSPDPNPVERLWARMRDEVTRGHCHGSVEELTDDCRKFVAGVNLDPVALVDRLRPVFELAPEFEAKLRVSTRV